MGLLRVGTSGYSFKEWKGTFYPSDLPDREMLPFYAQRLPAVEINYTFRHMPTAKTLATWASVTPSSFVFVLKASQRITHFQKLRGAGDAVEYFCTTAALLGPKLGPILFQLPPTFKKDASTLQAFLELLPPVHRYAFEFRHPTWFDGEVLGLLEKHQVSLCINETDEGAPELSVTAPYLYLRLRRETYTPEAIARWGERLGLLAAGGLDIYAFFKHEMEGPRYAEALLAAGAGGSAAALGRSSLPPLAARPEGA